MLLDKRNLIVTNTHILYFSNKLIFSTRKLKILIQKTDKNYRLVSDYAIKRYNH